MICIECACANQPLLIEVYAPRPNNDAADTVSWLKEQWCLDCILDQRPDLASVPVTI